MRIYDHRGHAGNAGDVWKHLLLLEVASRLLIPDSSMVYAESHAGSPSYALSMPGDWEGGIGKCWPALPILKNFCYFEILSRLNPVRLECYPGSTYLILQAAGEHCSTVWADIWDIDAAVAASWQEFLRVHPFQRSRVAVHCSDGFSQARSLLDRSPPGLMLIDPPYIDSLDRKRAQSLFSRAQESGWIVLWWYMMGKEVVVARGAEKYELLFGRAGLDCGRWRGCGLAAAGLDDRMQDHLHEQADRFICLMEGFKCQTSVTL